MDYEPTIHTLRRMPRVQQELPAITRQDILDCDGSAFILRGFLSPSECKYYIKQAEKFGMESHKLSCRVTDRVAAKSQPVADELFQRLYPFLKPCMDLTNENDSTWPTGVCWTFPKRKWVPVGLNEVFRICRYEPGGFFKPHHDRGFRRQENNRSIKTFMVYLNDDFVGGPTNFYDSSQRHYCQGCPEKVVYSHEPQAGDALVFNSAITHEGGKVREGYKYIMRSEVMYSSSSDEKLHQDEKPSYPPDHDADVVFLPD